MQASFHPNHNAIESKRESELESSTPFLLQPLLVVGLGRSGTTLLMAHLARDRRILFNRTHPFEVRVLSTLAKFCQTFPSVPMYSLALNLEVWRAGVKEKSDFCLATGSKETDLKVDATQKTTALVLKYKAANLPFPVKPESISILTNPRLR